jgi:hypothetical protein
MAGTISTLLSPTALTNTYTTNIWVPPAVTVDNIVRHIHIANITAGAVTFRMFMGATGANAAGTELWYGYSVAANSAYDWYGLLRLTSTTYLVGGASAATSLTITIMGEKVAV